MMTSDTYLLLERNKPAREIHEKAVKNSNISYVKELERKLDKKDWEILKHIQKMKMASSTQIQNLVYTNVKYGNRYTTNKLLKLFKWGCIDRCFPTIESGGAEQIVVLARPGAKLLKIEKFTRIKKLHQKWKHIVAVNDLYVHFITKYDKIAFNTELKLPYTKGSSQREVRVDALIQWGKNKIALFEVDLDTEPQKKLNDKIDAYHEYYNSDEFKNAPWQKQFKQKMALPIIFVLNNETRLLKLEKYYNEFKKKHSTYVNCQFYLFNDIEL